MLLLWFKDLLAVRALAHLCFSHALGCVIDAVIVFQVAQERNAVVDDVFYYQIAPAVAAFDDVLVRTGFQCP